MNPFKKLRRQVAKTKLAEQLAADPSVRTLCLSIQTADNLTFTATMQYRGPLTAAVLHAAEVTLEELDWKVIAAHDSLHLLAVEQGVPQPEKISIAPDPSQGASSSS